MRNEKLRHERIKRGWTQSRVAAYSGIASPDYSGIETGRLPAFPGWRKKLAAVFGVSEAELFEASQPDQSQRPQESVR